MSLHNYIGTMRRILNYLLHSCFQFFHISIKSIPRLILSSVKLLIKNEFIQVYNAVLLPVLGMLTYKFDDSGFSSPGRACQCYYHKIALNASITFSFCICVPTVILMRDSPAPLKEVQSLTITPFFRRDSETSFALRGKTSIIIKF